MTAHAQTSDPDKIESADGGIGISIGRILKLLARPELSKWRPVMVLAILLTLAAAVLEVAFPLLLGYAINKLVANDAGIIAGFVGGIVVSLISKSPLGVSGPAAGLAVLVYAAIQELQSLHALSVVVSSTAVSPSTLLSSSTTTSNTNDDTDENFFSFKTVAVL